MGPTVVLDTVVTNQRNVTAMVEADMTHAVAFPYRLSHNRNVQDLTIR